MTDPLDEARRLVATPAGEPGSGRVRYGAAMALYQAGALTAAELEQFRVASAHDGQGAGGPAPTAAEAIAALVTEADRYLATLPGPGVAEVRQGLARWSAGAVMPAPPRPHPVVTAHLPTALAALSVTHPALAGAIAAVAPFLAWAPYDRYPPERIGPAFAAGHAFSSFVGEGAPVAARDFDLGLFVIAPHVLYRDHRHAAPELYAPLTGPHGWRFGPDRPLMVKPAHQPVWNPAHQPHLTKVGPVPFLCLFGWTRDVNEAAEVIPATDWPALEALRLG